MKYLLYSLLFLLLLFSVIPVHAQSNTPSVFYCVGNNPQPPCATVAPTQSLTVSMTPKPSEAIPMTPGNIISLQPSSTIPSKIPTPIINPCQGQQSVVSEKNASSSGQTKQKRSDRDHDKKHFHGKKGLLQQFSQLLLQLLLQLLQLVGVQFPEVNPCSQSPSPSIVPSSAAPSISTVPISGNAPSAVGAPTGSGSQNCIPSAVLVNPCGIWLGAAARGNPSAASDRISQFDYLEKITGRSLDIYHDYDAGNTLPLTSDEVHFATRPNTYIYVNWKPASKWADADGANATVNANIDKAAANIKTIAPHKIFMTIWHEPENDVTPGTSNCPNLKGTAGSPAQYRAMWQNVENRFKNDGVTNVVWVMNYMGYAPFDCLIPQLWPGNNLIDWVAFESYGTNKNTTWATSGGRMYNVLKSDQSSTTDFASKPWAVAEFGTCKMTSEQLAYSYFQSLKAMLDSHAYPNIKMMMVYADTGNNAGPGCLTNYAITGTSDPMKQIYFNQLANDPVFK